MGDRRTLVAFLAIGAILLLLPYYYEWMGMGPARQTVSQGRKETSAEHKVGSESAPPSVSGSVPQAQKTVEEEPSIASEAVATRATLAGSEQRDTAQFTAREIVVQTPLQRLRFSTRGGALVGCELDEYRTVDGTRVELIPPGGRGLLVRIAEPGQLVDLADAEFSGSVSGLTLGPGERGTVRFRTALSGGKTIEKELSFRGDRYGFDLRVRYSGWEPDSELYLCWDGGVAITEARPQVDLKESRVLALFNGSIEKVKVSGDDKPEQWEDKGSVEWVGARSKYFLAAVLPSDRELRTTVSLYGEGTGKNRLPKYRFKLGVRMPERRGAWKATVYAGPLEYDNLKMYGVDLERAIDFGFPVVRQISRLLLVIFKAMHGVIPNYGWIIVIFAVVIKLLVYPLTHKTYESTAKMQELQPKIAALKEKYGRDQQRLSRETMRLYKEEGVNPLGGCLPMVLQMPIFFALYNLFGRTIELRQAPFIGWIKDLSMPEGVHVLGYNVHVLPILMGLAMLVQQKMTMKDPKQAMLVYLMPAMMIFVFWRMSSGLVLYWTIFNVLTIAQQVLVSRLRKDGGAVASRG